MKDLDEKRQGNNKFEMIRVKETTIQKQRKKKRSKTNARIRANYFFFFL